MQIEFPFPRKIREKHIYCGKGTWRLTTYEAIARAIWHISKYFERAILALLIVKYYTFCKMGTWRIKETKNKDNIGSLSWGFLHIFDLGFFSQYADQVALSPDFVRFRTPAAKLKLVRCKCKSGRLTSFVHSFFFVFHHDCTVIARWTDLYI